MDLSTTTAQKTASLQTKLDRKLGPEYVSQRPGPGGGPKLTYVEGWKVINLANEVFGFNGWSSSIVNLNTDFIDYSEETRRFSVGTSAVVRVTLRDGTYHEDVGYGILENSKSKGAALDKVCLVVPPTMNLSNSRSSARKKLSRMGSSVLSETSAIFSETAYTISRMHRK